MTYNNSNYGYAVATNKTFIAISNPTNFVYNVSSSMLRSGSVEILQYDDETNSYKHRYTIKKHLHPEYFIADETSSILSTETGSWSNPSASYFLLSDESSSVVQTDTGSTSGSSYDIVLDLQEDFNSAFDFLYEYGDLNYTGSKFGKSLAIYGTTLVIGDPLFYFTPTNAISESISGSMVDIYEMSGSLNDPVYYVTSISNSFESSYNSTTTFGESVSIYNDILAIGASSISSSKGAVYLYKKISGQWNYYQTLSGSSAISGSRFGGAVKIDQSGSYNIIVGNTATGSGLVYVFGYDSSSGYWKQNSILYPNRELTSSLQDLNHNWPPYITSSANPDAFGNSVGIYGNQIIVGAPKDTQYFQYENSPVYRKRGAVYFYENCTDDNISWRLIQKSFGSDKLLNTNYFGWDVDLYGTSSIVSSLKTNWPFSSSYIENTLYKKFDCNPNDEEYNVLGQIVIYEKSGSAWSEINTITNNKKYGEPYKVYGYDVSMYDGSFVIGAPVIITL